MYVIRLLTGSRHESRLHFSIDEFITYSSDIRTTSHSLVKKMQLVLDFFFLKTVFLIFFLVSCSLI